MKSVPNILSLSRMFFSFVLFLVKPLSLTFYLIYSYCGISDFLDGFIARRTGAASKFGSRLDSLSDFIMIAVLLVLLYPIINPSIGIILWIISICIIRFASAFLAFKKFKVLAIIHTYGNKLTGVLIFLSPFALPYIQANVLIGTICIVASLSSIEELFIQISSSQLDLDRKSIFIK